MNIEPKTELTGEEKLTVAYFHLVRGFKQHDLAALFRVNSGRVAEAVIAVRDAIQGLEPRRRREKDELE